MQNHLAGWAAELMPLIELKEDYRFSEERNADGYYELLKEGPDGRLMVGIFKRPEPAVAAALNFAAAIERSPAAQAVLRTAESGPLADFGRRFAAIKPN